MTRRIVNMTSVSLDGVIEHMEHWHFDYVDDELGEVITEQLDGAEVLLLGRRSYESWAEVWPTQSGAIAETYNSMTKYVASTTLRTADWAPRLYVTARSTVDAELLAFAGAPR